MVKKIVSKFFEVEPIQWGLRGDPYLWEELKIKTEMVEIPRTTNDLEKLLYELFKDLTGQEPINSKHIFVRRYNFGGMSGGWVDSDFWLDKGFPLIIQRYKESELQ